MTSSVSRRALAAGITLLLGAAALSGCDARPPGELGRLQQLLRSCPPDQPVNSKVITDVSDTSVSDQIIAERLDVIRDVAERTAVCGGHLDVSAFAANSITAPIYEGDLQLPGATDNGRLRQVPDAVDEVMEAVTAHYEPAIAEVATGGTDVTGLLRLLGEAQELRPDHRLEAHLLTDGLTNQGIVIDHTLTAGEATALADQVTVPALPDATISVIGVGRVTGDPLPSDFIAGMSAFYTRLCENTGAAECLVVTDGH